MWGWGDVPVLCASGTSKSFSMCCWSYSNLILSNPPPCWQTKRVWKEGRWHPQWQADPHSYVNFPHPWMASCVCVFHFDFTLQSLLDLWRTFFWGTKQFLQMLSSFFKIMQPKILKHPVVFWKSKINKVDGHFLCREKMPNPPEQPSPSPRPLTLINKILRWKRSFCQLTLTYNQTEPTP